VIGWLILRGKCSNCLNPISLTYPATELLFGIAFAAYVTFEGLWPAGLLSLPMMGVGYCAAVIRLKTGRLVLPLVTIYILLLIAQLVLTQLGYSVYSHS
jgi:leader peptidase (prepilin peptidase)/N-methyltransferase